MAKKSCKMLIKYFVANPNQSIKTKHKQNERYKMFSPAPLSKKTISNIGRSNLKYCNILTTIIFLYGDRSVRRFRDQSRKKYKKLYLCMSHQLINYETALT